MESSLESHCHHVRNIHFRRLGCVRGSISMRTRGEWVSIASDVFGPLILLSSSREVVREALTSAAKVSESF